MQYEENEKHWYVLLITNSRVLRVRDYLQGKEIQCFVPMKHIYVVRDGQRKRVERPAVSNLLFVHTTSDVLAPCLADFPASVHLMRCRDTYDPVVIPEREMTNFMLVAGAPNEDVIYLNDNIEKFSQHDKVRVMGGMFEGLEGHIVRIRRDRKLVVSIQGLVAVAVSNIHPSLLEKIE